MEAWAVVIDTPNYEQVITFEMPDGETEDSVREYASKFYTVYEVWKEEKDET